MCSEFKSKKDIVFFSFALGFSNRNLTAIYTEIELKNSATYSLEGHAQKHNGLVLLLKPISAHGNRFLSFVDTDDKDGHGFET